MYINSYHTYKLEILSGHTGLDHLLPELVRWTGQGTPYSSPSAAVRGGHRAVARAARAMGHPSLAWGVEVHPHLVMTAGF